MTRSGTGSFVETGFHPREAEVDRLFAEDSLARLHELFDQVGMGVCGRADHDRVDVGRHCNLVDRADRAAVLVGDGLRRGGKGVGHGNESCLRVARYGLGMHLADASCAQKAKSDRHVSPHSG